MRRKIQTPERPASFQKAFATLYRHLGIDVRTSTIADLQGRPQNLIDSGMPPLRELVQNARSTGDAH